MFSKAKYSILTISLWAGSVLILKRNSASVISFFWWTILVALFAALVYRGIFKRADQKLDFIGLISLVVAGLLALQLNQPLFKPSIFEYSKIDSRLESRLYWPRALGTEPFTGEVIQYSNYEITVQPPLFPFSNRIEIPKVEHEGFDVAMFLTELRGPVDIIDSDSILIAKTLADGFTVRSVKLFSLSISKTRIQDALEIKTSKHELLNWIDLSTKELDFYSEFIFNNEIDLGRFINDKSYNIDLYNEFRMEIIGNTILFDTDEPDAFELEKCKLSIINKSNELQTLRLMTNGFYPRYFFERIILEEESIVLPNLTETITLQPGEERSIDVIELKTRRSFDQIVHGLDTLSHN